MPQPPGGYQQQGYPQQQFPPPGGYVPQQHYGWASGGGGGQQPPLGWGPGFGGGPQWQPPKKSKGPLIGLVAVLGVLGVGVATVIGFASRSGDDEPTVVGARPSARATTSASPPPLPTITPRPKPTSGPSTTRPTPPPPKPRAKPKPPPSAREIASRSRIYATGTHPSLGCREPGVRATSAANVKAYNAAVKACLDRSWLRQERAGGFKARPPAHMLHFSGAVETPCTGGVTQRSFYCSANETIYMYVVEPMKLYRQWGAQIGSAGRTAARMRQLFVMAHEYGHHVQAVTGILQAEHEMRYQASSREGVLQSSRRTELQASCFAAVFVGANRRSLPITGQARTQWNWLIAHTGDFPPYPRDHGSFANNKFWMTRGFNGRTPGVCNTFTASGRAVS
jgi:predicted metalloprotease